MKQTHRLFHNIYHSAYAVRTGHQRITKLIELSLGLTKSNQISYIALIPCDQNIP